MGLNSEDFAPLVQSLVEPHVKDQSLKVTKIKSSGGKYVSVRIHFTATSLQQLEAIYTDLRASERVLFVL